MSGFFPDKFAQTARLSVKINNGVCTLTDGRPLPAMKTDAYGELAVSPWDIIDDFERDRLLKENTVLFLPAETSIWARVKADDIPSELKLCRHSKQAWPKNPGSFVEIQMASPVSLVVRGDGRAALGECNCRIPALPDHECASINEAYTRISEAFEPTRRSHTGNIFNCVFHETGTSLFPLRKLRDEKLSQPASESSSL